MTTPDAGWYTDPGDTQRVRWWDGAAWTGHVRPHPGAAAQPVQPPVQPMPPMFPPQPGLPAEPGFGAQPGFGPAGFGGQPGFGAQPGFGGQ
ncbi:DUF2510 domain-containing protein, partial [Leifsonia shinshuensis]